MILLALLAMCQAVESPRPGPTDTLRVYALGDINVGRGLVTQRLLKGDTLYPFLEFADTLFKADITFGNLESPIGDSGRDVASTSSVFVAPPVTAVALARAGFDIVSTANNHAWDADGQKGVAATMRALKDAGVRFVGSGTGRELAERPVILRRHGWRVAFLAVTRAWNPAPYTFYQHEGANWIAWGDTAWLCPTIRMLKASGSVDLVVLSVHGGHEYVETPPDYHTALFTAAVDAGADLILAHHPHVLQKVVTYKGKPIVQSLGNFVFSQVHPWTDLSAIVRVDVAPDKTFRISAIPVRVGYQPRLATGAAADSIRRRLAIPLSLPDTGQ